ETGDALVMYRDRLDVVGTLVERVDELDIAVTAQAEGVRHLLADQIVDNDLGSVEPVGCRHRSSPLQLSAQISGAVARRLSIRGVQCGLACRTGGPAKAISHNAARQLILWYALTGAHTAHQNVVRVVSALQRAGHPAKPGGEVMARPRKWFIRN